MADICGQCTRLDWKNKEKYSSTDKYWCKSGHGYKSPNDKKCNYDFCYNPESSHTPNSGYTPSGCYITTMVCNILGYQNDCALLTLLRKFRENVLKCDFKYYQLLIQYDMIGPEISRAIYQKDDKYAFALHMCDEFLFPCAEAIKEGMLDGAVEIYKNMIQKLSEELNITIPEAKRSENYELNTLGKGRILNRKALI